MITINPTAEAPTTDQRIAQMVRQFNNISAGLAQVIANGLPAQAQVTNPQGVVVRPAQAALSAQDVSDSLDRVIGTTGKQALMAALGLPPSTPVAPVSAPAQ